MCLVLWLFLAGGNYPIFALLPGKNSVHDFIFVRLVVKGALFVFQRTSSSITKCYMQHFHPFPESQDEPLSKSPPEERFLPP